MTDFEVNSAGHGESRFEGDWAQTQGCGQTRYFARILLHLLPPWLEDEIRANRLSILDWGCAEGEAVDSFRTHFPQSHVAGIDRSASAIRNARQKFGAPYFVNQDVLSAPPPVVFDVLVISNLLQHFQDPWPVLRKLGIYAARHLLILVPFREESPSGSLYPFDDATIGTRIDPDFSLSSARMIDCGGHSAGYWPGSQILLVYSRARYVPHSGAVFDESAWDRIPDLSSPPSDALGRTTDGSLATEVVAPAAASLPNPAPELWDRRSPFVVCQQDPIETILLPQLRRARSIAVVACAVPFSSALNQRPICCAKFLADQGTTVLFVEVWEAPGQPVHPTGEEVYPGVFSIPFYAFRDDIRHTFQDNIDRIASVSHANRSYLCTLPTRALVEAARVLRAAGYHIHYDIMDDWEAFLHDDEEMTHWFSAPVELEMVALADTVTAVSGKLVEKFERLRPDILEVRNGYRPADLDCEQFTAARAPLERPKVVGYFGHLSDAWFDWETVFYAARKRPDIEFELIGYGLSDRSLLRLHTFPNIRFVGLVPQKNLQHYARKWWAGMIPFQPSTLSAAVDPLKVYEYLHFGLPTVVTGIPGIADYPLIEFAGDPDSFVSALDRLPDRPDEQSLSRVAEFLKACVWEARLASLNSLTGRQGGEAELAVREAALRSDERYWQARIAELGKQQERQRRLWAAEREPQRLRETELAMRETALRAEVELWQAKAAELGIQLEEQARIETGLRASQQRLEEAHEAELAAREAVLGSHAQYWQAKSVELGKQLDEQRQENVRKFRTLEENSAAEIRTLTARAAASASEAANLRRLTTDLLRSRSWKITAPLRFLSKPLFTAPVQQAVSACVSAPSSTSDAPEPVNPPNPLEPIFAELRRAQSIAVVPCAVPFTSTANQRPISCAKHLADHGSTVLYVAWQWSPGEELPPDGQELYPRIFQLSLSTFQANLDALASASGPQCGADPLVRGRPPGRPVAKGGVFTTSDQADQGVGRGPGGPPHIGGHPPIYLCSLPSAALVEAVRPLRAGGYHIHYDIMDDWEEFQRVGEAPWYSASVEREMVVLSDTVTAVSDQLAQKFARFRSDIVVVRNGYDPAALGCRQFVAARSPLERPKVVGYFGHLSDAWFDWETVLQTARKLPDVEFELIGYGLSDRSRARLGDFRNIRFAGLVAQNDLHRYARKWWAGMIPFRPSALSAAVDPLKIYEYLHFGLPTVVTGVSGIAAYPLVRFAKDPGGFLSALDQVQDRPGEPILSEVADFLRTCVWEQRLAKLNSLLGQPAGLASLYAH
jgi:glycosyltransferase involved in cell wall biosynthesis